MELFLEFRPIIEELSGCNMLRSFYSMSVEVWHYENFFV